MKLYHVSYDPIWFFNPRVPKSRLPMEDAETPRICLSDRIERCVNAKPCQAQALYLAKEYGLRVPLMYMSSIPTTSRQICWLGRTS